MNKFLDLDTLLADATQPVYIRNTSLKHNLMVVLEIKDANGKGRSLKIPPSRFPICITDKFPREALKNSNDLRVALTRGNIALVPAKEAQLELTSPDAAEELKVFEKSIYADDSRGTAMTAQMAKLNKQAKAVRDKTDVLKKNNVVEADVNVRIKALLGSFKAKEKSAKDILSQLNRLKSVLTKQDLTYIMTECSDDKSLKTFAENAMAELEAGPESPFEG